MKPQLVVEIEGGISDTYVTRGDVETITIDWDNYTYDLDAYTLEDLKAKRAQLATVVDPGLRNRLVARMGEFIERAEELETAR